MTALSSFVYNASPLSRGVFKGLLRVASVVLVIMNGTARCRRRATSTGVRPGKNVTCWPYGMPYASWSIALDGQLAACMTLCTLIAARASASEDVRARVARAVRTGQNTSFMSSAVIEWSSAAVRGRM